MSEATGVISTPKTRLPASPAGIATTPIIDSQAAYRAQVAS
jgi:hypothetical protein